MKNKDEIILRKILKYCDEINHYDEAWDVIQNDIPQLISRIESILNENAEN